MHKVAHIVVLIVVVCALPGCTGLSLFENQIFDSGKSQIQHAEKLLEAGKYQEAAAVFWSIAKMKSSPQREALQLRAAEATLQPQTKLLAQRYLDEIDEDALTQDMFVRKRVAMAELELLNGRPQLALDKAPVKLVELSQTYALHVLEVRVKALQAIGLTRESVETRVAINTLLKKPEQLKQNNQLLWEALLNSGKEEINIWTDGNENPDLAAWLSLASIQKQPHKNLPSLKNKLQQWHTRYPNHRIPDYIVDSIAQDWASLKISPDRIALLLPVTGRYSNVAQAIYAGITTAREFGTTFTLSPEIILYDTGDDPAAVADYYQRAVSEGADFIIGPLQKDAVRILAAQEQLEVPTLSLNYADGPLAESQNLFQFGLLPEDEARQVAERALLDNYHAALVLIPESEWGTRLLEAFATRFVELGGTVLQSERYITKNADYSVAIKNLLQLNQSEQRRHNVQAIIKQKVEFEPKRRQDADFIFIAASHQQARLLRPQLSYHYASDLPVYATSHIFSGNENISADQDINGVTYCDIPWLLSNDFTIELLRDSLDSQSLNSQSRLPRFAALGVDAYQIIPHLQRLATYEHNHFDGVTGKLSIGEKNRIYRELNWAKFQNGRPRLLSIPHDYTGASISRR